MATKRLKKIQLTLDDETIRRAKVIGSGDVSKAMRSGIDALWKMYEGVYSRIPPNDKKR